MKMIKAFLFAAVAVVAAFAQAVTEIVDGIEWTYSVSEGKASVTGIPSSTSGAVTIPSTLGGYPVASIGNYAFYNCSSLTSVTIPDSVTIIEHEAFGGCSSLTSITIPYSVTSIGSTAFSGCSSLISITIPDSVTSIGGSAFYECSSLTGVTIPDSVTNIGNSAFYGCSSLMSVAIPDSVTSIGYSAFRGCNGLADSNGFVIVKGVLYDYFGVGGDIVIPDSVTNIGNLVFSNCSSLTSVTMPNSITNIGPSAFASCSVLTSVTMGDSVASIGERAFYRCRSLASVTIPNSVTRIAGDSFFETPWGDEIHAKIVKLVSQKTFDGIGSQGGSSGSTEGGGATVTHPVNADIGYNLTESVEDRSISNIEINGDRALDEFVLKDGKVYDCVLRIVNVSDNAAKVILPKKYVYEKFRGTNPLLIPAASTNLLTITRTKADTFFISREELALEVQE